MRRKGVDDLNKLLNKTNDQSGKPGKRCFFKDSRAGEGKDRHRENLSEEIVTSSAAWYTGTLSTVSTPSTLNSSKVLTVHHSRHDCSLQCMYVPNCYLDGTFSNINPVLGRCSSFDGKQSVDFLALLCHTDPNKTTLDMWSRQGS
ncbi:hypothetical protein O181_051335 [Austropuccinia psidii MF-1]|uniref:Uncharacterized protein n=1 Tax=Austropuccinia psidii MF-1 TaxID=1389203 RepID=A0A9Q3DWY4_9BASI|nr:hypothetical protein [Austropuccinia psidii MF-1]